MATTKSSRQEIARAKAHLRTFLLAQRSSLSQNQQLVKSAQIAKRLFALPEFRRARSVGAYIGFGSEVLTDQIIHRAWKLGKKVSVPKILNARGDFKFVLFEPHHHLIKSKKGPL